MDSSVTQHTIIFTITEQPGADLAVSLDIGQDVPFRDLLIMTEWMIAVTARKSEAGVERAVELLASGALTYASAPPKDG